MRYINYNNSDGRINSIINIIESDLSLYENASTSFLNINPLTANIDTRNNIISGTSIVTLPDFPATYNTLSYNVSSSEYISLSNIPDNTEFILYKTTIDDLLLTNYYQLTAGIVDDNLLELNFDTSGLYKLEFNCMHFNNLTSTFTITAI